MTKCMTFLDNKQPRHFATLPWQQSSIMRSTVRTCQLITNACKQLHAMCCMQTLHNVCVCVRVSVQWFHKQAKSRPIAWPLVQPWAIGSVKTLEQPPTQQQPAITHSCKALRQHQPATWILAEEPQWRSTAARRSMTDAALRHTHTHT